MQIWLLTHSEEFKKTTGTGKLVKEVLNNECGIIEWSRVIPSKTILDLSPENTLLIYLCENEELKHHHDSEITVKNIIIIDGTWQQARKIYNQSPYLKRFKHYEIADIKSVYSKRRNQKITGLCTAEVAIQLLAKFQHPATLTLLDKFTEFNR